MALNIVELLRAIRKDRKATAVVILAGLAILSLIAGVFGEFVILMLAVVAMLVAFFVGELQLKKFGIEFVTLSTVIAGFVYGPLVGAVFGVALLTLHCILARSLGPYVVYCIPSMGIIGLLAGYATAGGWFGGNIMMIGISLTLLHNLITGGLGVLLLRDFFEELIWSGSNFALNFVLFAKVAPIILLAMT